MCGPRARGGEKGAVTGFEMLNWRFGGVQSGGSGRSCGGAGMSSWLVGGCYGSMDIMEMVVLGLFIAAGGVVREYLTVILFRVRLPE